MSRIVLFHNSPRVRRYFSALAENVSSSELLLRNVWGRPGRLASPPSSTVAEIIDYGMRRKAARPSIGPVRLAAYRSLYATAARLHYGHVTTQIEKLRPDAVGVWGGNAVDARAVVAAAKAAGLPCFQFENGFLPDTTQMDSAGVNALGSVPRDPGFYRNRGGAFPAATAAQILPRRSDARRSAEPAIALPDSYVFVPFQVQYDSQVLLHSPWLGSMEALVEAVLAARRLAGPGAPIVVFKEHPSCSVRYDALRRHIGEDAGVLFANGNPTGELIAGSRGVLTLNSTVGTEALMLAKPVLALGEAVYAIPGVAESARSIEAVANWLLAVASDAAPAAPLRESFLAFLAEEYLVPDRHQAPGPRHFAAVGARMQRQSPTSGSPRVPRAETLRRIGR